MTLGIDIDLANYPGITVAQNSSLFGSTYKLMIPLNNILPLVYRILHQMPESEKNAIHIGDKITVAKELGLDHVYRRPDIFRAVFYTAGIGFLALGIAENKTLNLSKMIPLSTVCNAALENKLLTGAGCVALSLGSSLIPDAISTGLARTAKATQDLVKGIASMIPCFYRGVVNVANATAGTCAAYKRAWTNNKVEMIHAHVITGIAGAVLYTAKIV